MSAHADEWVTRFVPFRDSKVDLADERRLVGMAIVFNSLSQDLGGFRERIAPAAVNRTIESGRNVDALLDHRREAGSILGSTESGLLKLRKRRDGLEAEITPPDTTIARDVIANVRAGLVKGMSFAFRTLHDDWEQQKDGSVIRTVLDMEFSEVSIVLNPAYLQTDISARTAALDRQVFEEFKARSWVPSVDFLERELRVRI